MDNPEMGQDMQRASLYTPREGVKIDQVLFCLFHGVHLLFGLPRALVFARAALQGQAAAGRVLNRF